MDRDSEEYRLSVAAKIVVDELFIALRRQWSEVPHPGLCSNPVASVSCKTDCITIRATAGFNTFGFSENRGEEIIVRSTVELREKISSSKLVNTFSTLLPKL